MAGSLPTDPTASKMLCAIFRRIEQVALLKVIADPIADPIAGENVWLFHSDHDPFRLHTPKMGGVIVREMIVQDPIFVFYWYVNHVAEAMFNIFPTHYRYPDPDAVVPAIVGTFISMHPESETLERKRRS